MFFHLYFTLFCNFYIAAKNADLKYYVNVRDIRFSGLFGTHTDLINTFLSKL